MKIFIQIKTTAKYHYCVHESDIKQTYNGIHKLYGLIWLPIIKINYVENHLAHWALHADIKTMGRLFPGQPYSCITRPSTHRCLSNRINFVIKLAYVLVFDDWFHLNISSCYCSFSIALIDSVNRYIHFAWIFQKQQKEIAETQTNGKYLCCFANRIR